MKPGGLQGLGWLLKSAEGPRIQISIRMELGVDGIEMRLCMESL